MREAINRLAFIKTRKYRFVKFLILLLVATIGFLILTVKIPSRNAPYFLIFEFFIFQFIFLMNKKINKVEDYYEEVLKQDIISGTLIKCNNDQYQILELMCEYDNDLVKVDEDIEVLVMGIQEPFTKLYIMCLTNEDENKNVDIIVYDGVMYVS